MFSVNGMYLPSSEGKFTQVSFTAQAGMTLRRTTKTNFGGVIV